MELDGHIIDLDEDLSNLETLSKETNRMDNLYVFLNNYKKNFPMVE